MRSLSVIVRGLFGAAEAPKEHVAAKITDHAVPTFEGKRSRRHRRVPIGELRERAELRANGATYGSVRTLVQFAGFPRSGHSIVGCLIDAHPGALVSHELDMMGLVDAGLSPQEIFALIEENSASFEANGRFWNGHCYHVPGASGGRAERPLVLGDKKGDWAIRRLVEQPHLLSTVAEAFPAQRKAWIAVLRNPFDNVATLSLRKGRHYDTLRIDAEDEKAFKAQLAAETSRVVRSVLPEMVEDYRALCTGLAALKARIGPEDWLELRHEALVADPAAETARLFRFLGLPEDPAALDGAARVVSAVPNRSRHDIGWSAADIDAVSELIDRHDFLSGYAFEEGPARPRAVPKAATPRGAEPHPGAEDPRTRAEGTVRLFSCVGLDADAALLGHFIGHYARLGVRPAAMHLVLHRTGSDATALTRAREVLARHGVAEPEVWTGDYTSDAMWRRRRAAQQRHCGPSDWVVSADVDEFHVYPAELGAVIGWMDEHRIDVLDGPLIDRVAGDGTLPALSADQSLDARFPVEADVMCRVGKRHGENDATGTVKMMLFRAGVEPGLGGHGPAARGARFAYGMPLAAFPRIKDSTFRFRLPARVDHFKWHAAMAASVARRMATPGASAAGSRYGERVLDHLAAHGGKIDLASLPRRQPADAPPADWKRAIHEYREQARALKAARSKAGGAAEPRPVPEAFGAWRVRQLTAGTPEGRFHAHSYYDIPVLDEAGRRAVAFESSFAERWMTPEDGIAVGLVDLDRGGFEPVGRSHAWSWQQGPMAQFHPSGRQVFWNDRKEGQFVARLLDLESGLVRTLPRPVYAVDPAGAFALGVNMARLDEARPGYGYTGGTGAGLDESAPEQDGVWRMDLQSGTAALILPLARAHAALMDFLDGQERDEHAAADRIYWFNHVKLSPGGRRFTAKFRWRDRGPKVRWNGTMGVSVTCASDGADLRILARGTSHVMWLDESRLYGWHQSEKQLALFEDTAPRGTKLRAVLPETITQNVHIRHLQDDPDTWVLDTPYKERVEIGLLDVERERRTDIAAFSNHVPNHGPFRCDLHPVPSRDGRRIVVTSLHDGGRQLYVAEHASLWS